MRVWSQNITVATPLSGLATPPCICHCCSEPQPVPHLPFLCCSMAARWTPLPDSCLSAGPSRQRSASRPGPRQWDDSRRWDLHMPPRQLVKRTSRRMGKAAPDHATMTIQPEKAALRSPALQNAWPNAYPAVWQCIGAWRHYCLELRHTEPIKYRHSRFDRGSVCGQQVLAANVQGRNRRALGVSKMSSQGDDSTRTMPTGLLHVTIFAEVLHQAALHADARGPAREGRWTSGASKLKESKKTRMPWECSSSS